MICQLNTDRSLMQLNVPAVCGVAVLFGFMNPTLRRPEPYIFAQAEGRRGFIKPEKLARLLPYMESV